METAMERELCRDLVCISKEREIRQYLDLKIYYIRR